MKKAIQIILLQFVFSFTSIAQAILTGSSYNPIIGEGFVIHNCDTSGITIGTSGAGAFWDFSGLNNIYKNDSIAYIACDSTFYCSNYPGSTIVANSTSYDPPNYYSRRSFWYYYQSDTGSLVSKGDGLGHLGFFYKNPELIFKYPFTYPSYITDSFSNLDTIRHYKLNGSDTVFCDGYGDLKLPGYDYPNTLRIHKKRIYWDSVWGFSGSVPYYLVSDNYSWYAPGFHNFLLSISYNSYSGGNYMEVKFATGFIPNDVAILNIELPDFQVYPNPFKDELNINFSTRDKEVISVTLVDVTGREIRTIANKEYIAGKNQVNFTTSDFSKGIYFVRLKSTYQTTIRMVEIL